LFVRSSWEDDAAWVGFFGGQLQLFKDGGVTRVDPKAAREPLDIDAAIVFFARESKSFVVPHAGVSKENAAPGQDDAKENDAAVFIVGLDPRRAWHVEIDGQEMIEEESDPGGIIYLPSVPAGGVRLGPVSGS